MPPPKLWKIVDDWFEPWSFSDTGVTMRCKHIVQPHWKAAPRVLMTTFIVLGVRWKRVWTFSDRGQIFRPKTCSVRSKIFIVTSLNCSQLHKERHLIGIHSLESG